MVKTNENKPNLRTSEEGGFINRGTDYLQTSTRLLHYELNCMPPSSYAEALRPHETVFGDRVIREVIKVK